MPIYLLNHEISFPNPLFAEDGIVAIGGDLSEERLLLAYQNGIFPWYNDDEPIVWHAPNPRFVLYPDAFHASKSLLKLYNTKKYTFAVNQNFEKVIHYCQQIKRPDQDGTWITNEMENAYIHLHKKGKAHSVEVYDANQQLVGGLYGILMGKVFFGESMFHLQANTSKLAFMYLIQSFSLEIIDCQVYTPHLASLGAREIPLEDFLEILKKYTF